MFLNEELAEFCGALFGDGCLSKYYSKSENLTRYEIAFTGSFDEFHYHKNFLQPIVLKNFCQKGRVFLRGNSSRFHIRSKSIFNFFSILGFPVGKKGRNYEMPFLIRKDQKLSLAFVRGLWDTDGSIYRRYSKVFPAQTKFYPQYLVIQLKLNSKKMLEQVKETLFFAGVKSNLVKQSGSAFVLRITKQSEIKKYLQLIGFSNNHHNDRLLRLAPSLKV